MEQKFKILPISDRSFREIRQGNFLYADKTEFIYNALEIFKYKSCFLSRPRRFGKTLLLKTIDSLFQGDRKLFEGLWIDKSDYQFKKHPVLNFNMAYADIRTPDDLIGNIEDDLREMASEQSVTVTSNSYGRMMEQLLKSLSKKYGIGAVILVDEYDAPVTRHISDRKLCEANRDVLHEFYQSMKTNLDYIHFAFVTGITRFAMTSMDSGPNNFMDISLLPEFAGICGFTPSELDSCFKERFEETLEGLKDKGELPQSADVDDMRAEILKWYDGYNWLGSEHVLNPYSILHFFHKKKFGSYWPSSGRPSHLSALLKKNPLDYIQLSHDGHPAQKIRKTELSNITLEPILFHSGYLTIDSETPMSRIQNFKHIQQETLSLKIPNKEVSIDYIETISRNIFKPKRKYISDLSKNLPVALLNRNSDEVVRLLHDILVSISFHLHPSNRQKKPDRRYESEKVYHCIIHSSLLSAGFNVMSEASGGDGRSDMTLFLDTNTCVVIELKRCTPSKSAQDTTDFSDDEIIRSEARRREKELSAALDIAEEQMKEKDYAGPYRATRHRVICMALAIRNRTEVAVRFVEG
ncbi:MAG: ATP-binding protein [Deltaproteobacteria bacterium]|nr:ATP-binding protein [Deltaproteobacteria bacterium]